MKPPVVRLVLRVLAILATVAVLVTIRQIRENELSPAAVGSSPVLGATYSPPPGEYEGVPQELLLFCTAEEEVFAIQSKLLVDDFSPEAMAAQFDRMREIAMGQARALDKPGWEKAAARVREWAAALGRGRTLAARATDAFEALKPSVLALGPVNEELSCELDL